MRSNLVRTVVRVVLVATVLGSSASGGSDPELTDSEAGAAVLSIAAGGQIDFGSLEGRDTVLWFWAPW